MRRYFDEPLAFRPPYRSTFWLRWARWYAPLHRRYALNVQKIQFRGVAELRNSMSRAAGIVLTPNHWNFGDGPVVGALADQAGSFCYYLVSQHIFRQSRFTDWFVNRHGAISVWREGTDRESLRACIDILNTADRPLVIFPEGTWYRQNDRVGPLQQGVAMIALQAARHASRPIVIHPVAIKYWLLIDPRSALDRRLRRLEHRFGIAYGPNSTLLERIEHLTNRWLAQHEQMVWGQRRIGPIDSRRLELLDYLLGEMETQDCGRTYGDAAMERVWRLRSINAQRLIQERGAPLAARAERQLDRLLLCEHLFSHAMEYISDQPSRERMAESVQRLEEIITDDFSPPIGPMGVVVAAGRAIDVTADFAAAGSGHAHRREHLTHRIADDLQHLLDDICQTGPPHSWRVPRNELEYAGVRP
jgi:1-acyl-sn-glycerol-3-phosphate acyltransferase